MEAEQKRIQELADFLEIPMRMTVNGNKIELEFETWHDSAEVQLNAFGDTYAPGRHVHTEHFLPEEPEYQAAWVASAREVLDDLGIAYTVEDLGADTRFRFDRTSDFAVFVELRDREVFHHGAQHRLGGPALLPS